MFLLAALLDGVATRMKVGRRRCDRAPSAVDRLMQCLRDPSGPSRWPHALGASSSGLPAQQRRARRHLGRQADLRPRGDEPTDCLRGWQRIAALETHLVELTPTSRTPLLSQAGPHSERALAVLPTSEDVSIPSSHFWNRFLRRLRLRFCRGTLDSTATTRWS